METIYKTPVIFTAGAINEIKRLMSQEDFDPEKYYAWA